MISILIPIYNYDIRPLIAALTEQAGLVERPYEINCIDDGSAWQYRKENKSVSNLANVRYKELSTNVGRSRIRNLLAEQARFDHLLFLDCDGMPIHQNYLATYLNHLPSDQILVGGRQYESNPPPPSQVLHWKVGTKRESKLDVGFQSNNFLIKREIFLDIKFDELLIGYGHEDTLFGHELRFKDLKICHIENPVVHLGLESSEIFLKKQEEAIENLVRLHSKYPGIHTKLSNFAAKIERYELASIYRSWFQTMQSKLRAHLVGQRPSLVALDLYKVGYYLSCKRDLQKDQKVKPHGDF
ncbi:MAG: glycosyltransferase family 2 protein [Saprospiraceae bacterium]|nr:glycosyltransferase family 2 protein [Saprospiraceae bacterium]